MGIFKRHSKVTPKEAIRKYGRTINTNVTGEDLVKGAAIQLKRATDLKFKLEEIKINADVEAVINVKKNKVIKPKLKKPRRRVVIKNNND